MPRNYKCLVLKDRELHHVLKKLAAELNIPMIDLTERLLREGLERLGSRDSPSHQDAERRGDVSPDCP